VEPYPVDVDAKQLVQWLLDEERLRAFDLLVSVTRSYQREELEAREQATLGEAESEDLSAISEVGLLEVTPRQQPTSRWILRVRVEDDIAPVCPTTSRFQPPMRRSTCQPSTRSSSRPIEVWLK